MRKGTGGDLERSAVENEESGSLEVVEPGGIELGHRGTGEKEVPGAGNVSARRQ